MAQGDDREAGRSDQNLAGAADAASAPTKTSRDLEQGGDGGGSRDGERLETGNAGDREPLDNAGGRTQSRR